MAGVLGCRGVQELCCRVYLYLARSVSAACVVRFRAIVAG